MVWEKPEILKALKKLHKDGLDLSYNSLAARDQSLLSASAYHFGSYRKAIEKAGIGYESIIRRPRWTKTAIIALIENAAARRGPICTGRRSRSAATNWARRRSRRCNPGSSAVGTAP